MSDNFKKELEMLINRYSLENASNTPDFILAEYIYNCLNAFNLATQQRTSWYKGSEAREELSQRLNQAVSDNGRARTLQDHPSKTNDGGRDGDSNITAH